MILWTTSYVYYECKGQHVNVRSREGVPGDEASEPTPIMVQDFFGEMPVFRRLSASYEAMSTTLPSTPPYGENCSN